MAAPAWGLIAIALGLLLLARPAGRSWLPWTAVAATLVLALVPARGPVPSQGVLTARLDSHCRSLLRAAEETAADPSIRRVVAVTGEAVDPLLPFSALERHVPQGGNITLFLADDRGRMVAWAGSRTLPPPDLRALGERRWQLAWSATHATLVLREPILVEGRLAGSVLVLSTATTATRRAFGLRAPRGRLLRLGEGPDALAVAPHTIRPLTIPISFEPQPYRTPLGRWLAVWAVGLLCLADAPAASVAIGVLLAVLLGFHGSGPPLVTLATLLLAAAASARTARTRLSPAWRVPLTLAAAGTVLFLAVVLPGGETPLLPGQAWRPGAGAALALAAAWIATSSKRGARWAGGPLSRRLAAGLVVALLLAGAEAARWPLMALGHEPPAGPPLPRQAPRLAELLPAAPERCSLEDLAPALAAHWGFHDRRVPTEVRVLSADGPELSRWGDLGIPAESGIVLRRWRTEAGGLGPLDIEILGGRGPWSRLRGWSPRPGRHREGPVWWAVLGRSGEVEATLHPEVRGLDAATAGALFHRGRGWALLQVGWGRLPARMERQGEALVARILRVPGPAVWVLRVMLAVLWAVLGFALALPPARWRPSWDTFGGRLRLLVAAGILLPLSVLTLLMQEGLRAEEVRLRRAAGTSALTAVRWTLGHLAGEISPDRSLAASLAEQTGAEVVLFGNPFPLAASRPDLVQAGTLPSLPPPPAYARHLLGRDDPVLVPFRGSVLASSSVPVGGQRVLVTVMAEDPSRTGDLPGVADWLLTGAALAALVALALTGRIEERLGASLRALIATARRIQAGQPPGALEEPAERDLAEVVRAVQRMSEEVARREASLRHQEELLRITLATLEPAVVVLERTGGVRLTNPSGDRLLQDHGQAVMDRIREMGAGGTGAAPEVRTVAPYAGRDLTWRLGVASVPLPDGESGLVAVVEDVTEVVRADRLRQLTQLARIVAHEVKNPLTPIRLWVQEVEAALDSPASSLRELVAEACQEIAAQVDRLQATSQAFSNLVALERWAADRTDLGTVVEEAAAPFRVLERRGIRLQLELPPAGEAVVTGDRQWLRRLVVNLIQNSVDALGDGPGWIRVTVTGSGEAVSLQVADSGGGVPPERLEDLFEPHFSTTSGGSGLGLALVRMVAGRLGGTVEARNAAEGLEVQVVLPRASATMNP